MLDRMNIPSLIIIKPPIIYPCIIKIFRCCHIGRDVGLNVGHVGLDVGHVGLNVGHVGLNVGHNKPTISYHNKAFHHLSWHHKGIPLLSYLEGSFEFSSVKVSRSLCLLFSDLP